MNQRQKGARGEREAAHELNRVLGLTMRRGVQFAGGPESPDVVGLPGVHLEVKRVEKLNLEEAMKQAERDCGGSVPVVMHRRNNRPWLWTFRLEDVERLILAVRKAAGQDGGKNLASIDPCKHPIEKVEFLSFRDWLRKQVGEKFWKEAEASGLLGMPFAGAGKPLESLTGEKTGSDMGLTTERVESPQRGQERDLGGLVYKPTPE